MSSMRSLRGGQWRLAVAIGQVTATAAVAAAAAVEEEEARVLAMVS